MDYRAIEHREDGQVVCYNTRNSGVQTAKYNQDGAVINFIMNGNSSMLNALIMGMIRTVWR